MYEIRCKGNAVAALESLDEARAERVRRRDEHLDDLISDHPLIRRKVVELQKRRPVGETRTGEELFALEHDDWWTIHDADGQLVPTEDAPPAPAQE
jgi:hypothetical protein